MRVEVKQYEGVLCHHYYFTENEMEAGKITSVSTGMVRDGVSQRSGLMLFWQERAGCEEVEGPEANGNRQGTAVMRAMTAISATRRLSTSEGRTGELKEGTDGGGVWTGL